MIILVGMKKITSKNNVMITLLKKGLWNLLLKEWFRMDLNSPSLHGKIQYIVEIFND